MVSEKNVECLAVQKGKRLKHCVKAFSNKRSKDSEDRKSLHKIKTIRLIIDNKKAVSAVQTSKNIFNNSLQSRVIFTH